MEVNRLKLHNKLCELTPNVYYQPPSSIKMKYPAIVYCRSDIDNEHANNSVYNRRYSYEITVVEEDIDSEIVQQVLNFSKCKFNRHFVSDNLNHTVFNIFI